MAIPQQLGPIDLDRMVRAVEKVRERLLRSTSALERAGVAYAVVGGNAVAAWVSRIDEAAVRNTRDVDILIRREDFAAARVALEAEGFVYRHSASLDMFLDGEGAKARDAVHILFANEKVRPDEPLVNPDVDESEPDVAFRLLSLEPLVRIKLSVSRDKDRMHLRDMIDIGLIDESWVGRFPPLLADRLRVLLDNPDG